MLDSACLCAGVAWWLLLASLSALLAILPWKAWSFLLSLSTGMAMFAIPSS